MKSLSNSSILKIHDAILFENRMYMFMTFMNGGALTQPITTRDREHFGFTEGVIKFILWKVAVGLEYLHHNNVIHRDIKSDNILLSREDNEIKICDFGYACQLTKER